MPIVFQYGSNCLDSEINSQNRLCGDAKFVDIGETVEDFELVFDVWSEGRGCAAADIIPKPGSKIWGVLYQVSDDLIDRQTANARGRKSFDAIEGEGTNYKREMIDVRRPSGQIVRALTYTAKNPKSGLKTSNKYAGYIVAGLREHGVSDDYIARVKQIATNNNPEISAYVEML
jgi:Gamma-glutamyl cyclotransferase, AIG2-like